MRITITGKNIEVSDYLNDLVIKKVSKLDKYFPEDTEAHVTLAVERNRHIVEVTIPYTGGIIRGEETSGDMYASIDNVLAKLEKQIMRHRTKLEKSLRAGAFKAPEPVFADSFSADEDEMEEAPRVVKVKRFDIKPMTVEEAMLQLELLGHSFYMFTNGDSGQINVIYKRKDGNFGLIEPEYTRGSFIKETKSIGPLLFGAAFLRLHGLQRRKKDGIIKYISITSMTKHTFRKGGCAMLKGPEGKCIFGTVKVGEKGQIVIPKEAREMFGIKPGDLLLLLGDEKQGIAIVKNEIFMQFAQYILNAPLCGEKEEEE